eukprot:scaffold6114_cov79-Skeletonema_dohrnii-CCMP3373.AAC.2
MSSLHHFLLLKRRKRGTPDKCRNRSRAQCKCKLGPANASTLVVKTTKRSRMMERFSKFSGPIRAPMNLHEFAYRSTSVYARVLCVRNECKYRVSRVYVFIPV